MCLDQRKWLTDAVRATYEGLVMQEGRIMMSFEKTIHDAKEQKKGSQESMRRRLVSWEVGSTEMRQVVEMMRHARDSDGSGFRRPYGA